MRTFDLSTELNGEQCKAASQIDGPLLVIAGAGSGKTRMLTYRIANLLQHGIPESAILALTFTNKAAREMGERVRSLTESPLQHLTTTTFHSFGMGVLKQYIQFLGYKNNFTIYDTSDKLALIREMIVEADDDPDTYDLYDLSHLFSDIKTKRTAPAQGKTGALYQEYGKLLKAYNAVDFDDLITLPLVLFERRPDVLKALRERFRYILVDEFQDTSLCQYRMVSALAKESRNLCVVGDDDQSIYSWRGANYQNLLLFEQEFPERKEIKLEENYRSSGIILEAANDLIVHNKDRKDKKLWTDNERGSTIRIVHPLDGDFEAQEICDTIRDEMAKDPRLTYDDFAILVRTNRLLSPIGDKLETENIPVNVTGGPNLLDRKEVRDVLSYLKCAANPEDDINLLRIINTPPRGIGRVTLEKIRTVADTFDCPLIDAIRRCAVTEDVSISPSVKKTLSRFTELLDAYTGTFAEPRGKGEALRMLVDEIGYKEYLMDQHPENEKLVSYQMNGILIFIKKLTRFEQQHPGAPIGMFLSQISLDSGDDDEQTMGKVSLMTMHAAKGLEFHTVFLAAVEEPYVPSGKALEEDPRNIDEERRLFYVAITRAKRNLIISSCQKRDKNGKEVDCVPSRFLQEIPQSLFDEEDPDRQLSGDEFDEKLKKMLAMFGG
ncbi:MAG: UvrD-helicase domain-containing protein [Sphaerochaeta sp.]|jgi:DNA helicase-2/ATP-dependent DNA helicase PcrA|nr:UvrD-helicase domain-containing protein [Sphaerochaeta sp.]MCH3920452.1 UvrD-helicase domain-containing protein [Sphaerochaeta sp.]MCI2045820.1 UvrD-helicase domain-containing protein [Sphaerochaeta sp.]MCI2076605.1 UvrD-helicase domain-containing protein [Sphaerochaeta sp.]MCI2097404.1 UvrD-helicase domain-containing protein [Sphaerochaeta sp.]